MMDMHDTFDTVIDGFKTMVEPLGVLVAAFILKDVNDTLGLAPYIVTSMEPILTPELLPAAIFVSMALVSFMTGSNWGVFVIVLPIVTALANNLNTMRWAADAELQGWLQDARLNGFSRPDSAADDPEAQAMVEKLISNTVAATENLQRFLSELD